MNKLTDYAILVLTHVAQEPPSASYTARDLAERSHVPLPTVSKVLKELHRAGLVVSYRGIKGGYQLARAPEEISVAQIVHALEGPIGLTECTSPGAHPCELQAGCLVKSNWRVITDAVRIAFEGISLAALARPLARPVVAVPAELRAAP